MQTDDLIKKLTDYGADVPGAMARFMGDQGLYAVCLQMLIDDPSFDTLGQAMAAGDTKAAFEAAHTLKGVSGNLGLTPLYKAVCALVESLRGDGQDPAPLYEQVVCQRGRLNELL